MESTKMRTQRSSLGFDRVLRLAMAVLAATLAFASTRSVARAEDAPPALMKYAGNYKYAGTRDQGIAIVDKAIDEGLSDLNMVMRMLIKKALEQHFVEVITIEIGSSGRVSLKLGDQPKVTTALGKTELVKSADGKMTAKVTHTFDGTKLTQTSVAENGTSTYVFELTADGKTLHRSVTFKGERLQKPVKYKLDYVRK